MSAYLGLILDVALVAALGVAVFHARKLSKQITAMQADRRAFEQLIAALNVASSRAESAIKSIKETVAATGDKLQDKINTARSLSEEMEIIIQAGDNLAERLQDLAEKSRKSVAPSPAAAAALIESDDAKTQPRSRAERELMEALKGKQQTS